MVSSYSTVFCAGNRCDESLLVNNDKAGVCEAGDVMPEPNLSKDECTDKYYICKTNKTSDLQHWERAWCVNDEVFNRYLNACSQECK